MSEIKLKRCPFCGGEATLCKIKDADLWLVKCWNRGCEMRPRTNEKETKEEAITIWNTRKPIQDIVERLKSLYLVNPYPNEFSNGRDYANNRAIEIVEEVGGIDG